HIFYAFRGPGGRTAAFHATYDFADEFTAASAMVPMQTILPADAIAASRIEPMPVLSGSFPAADYAASANTLEADRSAAPATNAALAPKQPQLEADRQRGVLTARGADSTLVVD